jgi:hypothetical protein
MTVVLMASRYPPCPVCGTERWVRLRTAGSVNRRRVVQCPHCGPMQLPIGIPTNGSRSTT